MGPTRELVRVSHFRILHHDQVACVYSGRVPLAEIADQYGCAGAG